MAGKIKIFNQEIKYQTSYRNVRYPRLEFKTGSLVLILPRDNKNEKEIIKKYSNWVYKKSIFIKNALKDLKSRKLNLKRTDEEFRNFVSYLVKNFSGELKVKTNRIFHRKMKSKWGSLSPKKNFTINTFSRYLPKSLIEYIVFHEMAHLIQRKHNEKFWKIMSKKYKSCARYELQLLKYWFLIQKRKESLLIF